jgi:hypothetical protein
VKYIYNREGTFSYTIQVMSYKTSSIKGRGEIHHLLSSSLTSNIKGRGMIHHMLSSSLTSNIKGRGKMIHQNPKTNSP